MASARQIGRRLSAQSERNWWLSLSTPGYPWFPAGSQQQQHGSRGSSAPPSLRALANSALQVSWVVGDGELLSPSSVDVVLLGEFLNRCRQ
ncbi:hypothetical protein NDU88_007807 [Pleurodeles waltl]|uniref:Uncharacterized protein n=1 Tax=Pleurodeles waltl TaxID=8319 RepID=A0AAV7U0R5_PLEWA|nr:hypothetical protein NDU88_007807 [Pleurodeles waltl]